MRADNTKRRTRTIVSNYVLPKGPVRTSFSPKYTVRESSGLCARQDLAQNVRNGLPACIEPEHWPVLCILALNTGFFIFLETIVTRITDRLILPFDSLGFRFWFD